MRLAEFHDEIIAKTQRIAKRDSRWPERFKLSEDEADAILWDAMDRAIPRGPSLFVAIASCPGLRRLEDRSGGGHGELEANVRSMINAWLASDLYVWFESTWPEAPEGNFVVLAGEDFS